jgi:threonine/homoserine/homoserine lactone efflux protein
MEEIPRPIKFLLDAAMWVGIAYLFWSAISTQPREQVSDPQAQAPKAIARN